MEEKPNGKEMHVQRLSNVLVLLIAAAGLQGNLHAAQATEPPPVFERAASGSPTRTDGASSTESMTVRVDLGLIQGDPDAITVLLPDGGAAVARRSYWDWSSAEEFHWFGDLDAADGDRAGDPPGSVGFHYYEGRLIGTLYTADGAGYRLVPEAGLHRLERQEDAPGGCSVGDAGEGPLARGLGVGSVSSAGTAGEDSQLECFTPPSDIGIDVMVLYPLSLRQSAQAVRDYAVAKVAEANQIFHRSDVSVVYTLTYVGPITGDQPPPPPAVPPPPGSVDPAATRPVLTWLNQQFDSTTPDTELELLRRAHGADMISIVIPPFAGLNCGIANLVEEMGGVEVLAGGSQLFDKKAFSVVELDCGNADYTFAHELGHNFGMRHENDRDERDIHPWAYAHLVPTTPPKATVMGCANPPTSCARIKNFSNPAVFFQFKPTGVHTGQPGEPAHNACVANIRAGGYRTFAQRRPTSPPSLEIIGPQEGATVQVGVPFTLTASATDPEDGDRSAFVQWRSDLVGFLGTGSPLTVTLRSGGIHRITATVTDSSGTLVPYSIRVSAFESEPPRRYIDRPAHTEAVTNLYTVRGWATDSSGVESFSFRVDGGPPFSLSGFRHDRHRADVCAVHGDLHDLQCPRVGFEGILSTANLVPGLHTLSMTVTDFWGNASTFNRVFRKTATRSFFPVADAWVGQAFPSTNFGGDNYLHLRASGSGQAMHAYLKFQVSGITQPVQSAKLRLRTGGTPLTGLQIYWIQDTSWTEGGITFNNAPLAHYLSFPTSPHPAGAWIEIDVTSVFGGGNGTYTLGMVTPTDSAGQLVLSKESMGFGPKLEILY